MKAATLKRLANALAHSQRDEGNASIFEGKGNSWCPTQRELERERWLNPKDRTDQYPPPQRVNVDKDKFNEEKRNRAKFNRSGSRAGNSRDSDSLRVAVLRGDIKRRVTLAREISSKDKRFRAKYSGRYKNLGHVVVETFTPTQEEREDALNANRAWKTQRYLNYIVWSMNHGT